MKDYPRLTPATEKDLFELARYITKERPNDVKDWDNLKNIFMSGRKVGKIPSSATDITPSDRVGDFNYDTTYYYFVVNTGGGPEWRTLPVTDFTGGGGGIGTVTNVSVVTANGLSGTVANATTTPAITLNISGLDATKIGAGGVTSAEFGYLGSVTSDIQTQLDAKVDENAGITGATKTKITYDTKGLVTAGADATTADIADSSNKRYVTDAQLVVIGNTSGTNTGDQTSIVGITGTKAQFDTAVTDGNFLYVGDVTQYTDEMAQDAVGGMVNTSLTYTDGTPLLALTSRTIGGVAYDGTANIVPATITVADTTDTTCWVGLFESQTGDLAPKSDGGLTYNASTGTLTAAAFAGPLTGNVTGNVSGSSGSTTGNAATVTTINGRIDEGTNVTITGTGTAADPYVINSSGGSAIDWGDITGTLSDQTDLQTALDAKQPLDATLTALAAYNTNGILTQTAADTFTGRTITGTLNRLTVTNGDGVSGNPTLDISSSYVGQNTITTLGTVTTGVWNGTDIAVADGGTGRSSHTAYAVLCGGTTTTSAQQSIASVGSSGEVLTSNGAGALPTFQAAAGGGANTALSNLAAVAINAALVLATSDAFALGSTTKQWSDLFLAEGGVINWDNGDATLTQVGDVVTLAGADLKVSSPGNVTTSVVTIDATQTLTNKTISGASNTITNVSLTTGVTGVLPPASGGNWVRLSTQTASSSATIDFTSFVNGTLYAGYVIVGWGIRPATDATDLWFRTSTDNGSSYAAGAANYAYSQNRFLTTTAGLAQIRSAGDTKIAMAGGADNAAAAKIDFHLWIYGPENTAFNKQVRWDLTTLFDGGVEYGYIMGVGARLATADIDALRFMFSSGNIAEGNFILYGIAK